jgi:hypothetical protein
LIESAIAHGVIDWVWHRHQWGVVFEVEFEDDTRWTIFRELPQVRAALDAVPDRINGLLIYRGRGGSAGTSVRRPRRPSAGAGALELPEPTAERLFDLTDAGESTLAGTTAEWVTTQPACGRSARVSHRRAGTAARARRGGHRGAGTAARARRVATAARAGSWQSAGARIRRARCGSGRDGTSSARGSHRRYGRRYVAPGLISGSNTPMPA